MIFLHGEASARGAARRGVRIVKEGALQWTGRASQDSGQATGSKEQSHWGHVVKYSSKM